VAKEPIYSHANRCFKRSLLVQLAIACSTLVLISGIGRADECDWHAQIVDGYAYQRDRGEAEGAVLAQFDSSLAGRPEETIEINRRLYHRLIDFAYTHKDLTPIETMGAYERACRGLPPLAPTQWYLLLPAMKGPQTIDVGAPLTEWDVQDVVPGFQSAQACQHYRESMVSGLTDANDPFDKRYLASVCHELNENSLFISPCAVSGACLHSNDPSLKVSTSHPMPGVFLPMPAH
jgi:hypothetical protein